MLNRATEENNKLKTRYEQAKEETENLVSKVNNTVMWWFFYFQFIIFCLNLQKEKIEVNQGRFVYLFVTLLDFHWYHKIRNL